MKVGLRAVLFCSLTLGIDFGTSCTGHRTVPNVVKQSAQGKVKHSTRIFSIAPTESWLLAQISCVLEDYATAEVSFGQFMDGGARDDGRFFEHNSSCNAAAREIAALTETDHSIVVYLEHSVQASRLRPLYRRFQKKEIEFFFDIRLFSFHLGVVVPKEN